MPSFSLLILVKIIVRTHEADLFIYFIGYERRIELQYKFKWATRVWLLFL